MKNSIQCFFSTLILTALSLTGSAQTNQKSADQITGLYWSPEKDAKIEIYKKGREYFGRSVWVAYPRKDTKNPIEALKTREVLGIDLFTNFSYEDGVYTSGKVYDPESGKTYDCKMSLNGDMLKVRGYIGISLFGRTEFFKRIK
ncbi:MAG: peptide protein [Daejeonella sp.]|nr:peptide protein [Daejeonella sp.]